MKDKASVSSTDSMGKMVRVLTTLVEDPSFFLVSHVVA